MWKVTERFVVHDKDKKMVDKVEQLAKENGLSVIDVLARYNFLEDNWHNGVGYEQKD